MDCCYCYKPIYYDPVLINQDGDFVHKNCELLYKAKMEKEMNFICTASDEEFESWLFGNFEV